MAEILLTDERIARLPLPKSKDRDVYRDSKLTGLRLTAWASGKKTYSIERWSPAEGRSLKVKLGDSSTMTVKEAREAAISTIKQILKGENPGEEKKALRGESTLGELFAKCFEDEFSPLKTKNDYKWLFDLYLDEWKNKRLSAIRAPEIQALIFSIIKRGGKLTGDPRGKVTSAHRVFRLIRTLFNHAARRGWKGENPTNDLGRWLRKNFPLKTRDRFILPDEMPFFWWALSEFGRERLKKSKEADPLLTQHFFMLLLFAGQRTGNTEEMKWEHIDLKNRVWRIPDLETKNRDPMIATLTAEAIEVLEARPRGKSPFVFPGRYGRGHLQSPKKAWARLLEIACTEKNSLKDLRMHDLRRSYASYQAMENSSLSIIGKSLGHKTSAATEIYARLQMEPVAASAAIGVAAMFNRGGVSSVSNILAGTVARPDNGESRKALRRVK